MQEVVYPPCIKCGKSHAMGLEEMETGKITPLDICYSCLWVNIPLNLSLITSS
jgi:hypothetical protein